MSLFELLFTDLDDLIEGRAKARWLRVERWIDSRWTVRCVNCQTELDENDSLSELYVKHATCRKCWIALAELTWLRRARISDIRKSEGAS